MEKEDFIKEIVQKLNNLPNGNYCYTFEMYEHSTKGVSIGFCKTDAVLRGIELKLNIVGDIYNGRRLYE